MSNPPRRIPVLLLKTKSRPADAYEEYFSNDTFSPTFVPVLEHRPNRQNLAILRSLLLGDKFGRHHNAEYGGMIFTSQRAVEGFANVVDEIEGNSRSDSSNQVPAPPETNIDDNSTTTTTPSPFPIYVVGPATYRTLTSLLLSLSKSPGILTPLNAHIFGSHTGNGEALAHYILQHYHSLPGPPGRSLPMLFLVGEQRRAIIPDTLMDPHLPESTQIHVDEHAVYETGVMESFARDFASQISLHETSAATVVIVVFSPSGCEAMLRCLGYIDSENKLTEIGNGRGRDGVITGQTRYVIVTIGPTTRDYLRQEFGFEADVCAETPSPEGVGDGVKKFLGGKATSENMTVG